VKGRKAKGRQDNCKQEECEESLTLTGIVCIAHFSVQEYLLSRRIGRGRAASFAILDTPGHFQISKTCLIYLCNQDFLDQALTPNLVEQYPFARFAAEFWYHHYRSIDTNSKAELQAWALALLETSAPLERWTRTMTLHIKSTTTQPDRPIRQYSFMTYDITRHEHTGIVMMMILNQLFCQDASIRPPVKELYTEKCTAFGWGERSWEWQRRELEALLAQAIVTSAQLQQVTVFIDALVEAGEDSARKRRDIFTTSVTALLPPLLRPRFASRAGTIRCARFEEWRG